MAVDGCDHNAVIAKGFNHRVNFFPNQHKISRNRCFAAAGGLKVNGGGCPHRGWHLSSHVVDLFASRDGELVNTIVIFTLMPECLIDLAGRLYDWSCSERAGPVGYHALRWDMCRPDGTYVLAVLVAASMWIQQKLTMAQASMTPVSDSQAQTNQTLLWAMPLMFGWFTITVPAGLAIYWVVTNFIGIIMNYYVFGWKGTSLTDIFLKPATATAGKGGRAGSTNGTRPARSDPSPHSDCTSSKRASALPESIACGERSVMKVKPEKGRTTAVGGV